MKFSLKFQLTEHKYRILLQKKWGLMWKNCQARRCRTKNTTPSKYPSRTKYYARSTEYTLSYVKFPNTSCEYDTKWSIRQDGWLLQLEVSQRVASHKHSIYKIAWAIHLWAFVPGLVQNKARIWRQLEYGRGNSYEDAVNTWQKEQSCKSSPVNSPGIYRAVTWEPKSRIDGYGWTNYTEEKIVS